MAAKQIENYITKRYSRWLDYAEYHCTLQKLDDQANDVLDEVLLMLLKKPEKDLLALYEKKKEMKGIEYTELDFYILRMLKLNITSPTAPYRHKTRSTIIDNNADISSMEVIDEVDCSRDRSGKAVEQMRLVRETLEELPITPREKEVFEWNFFHGNPLSEWTGPESSSDLYETNNWIRLMLKRELTGEDVEITTPRKRLRTPDMEHQVTLF